MLPPFSLRVVKGPEEMSAELLSRLPEEPDVSGDMFMFCEFPSFPVFVSPVDVRGLVRCFGLRSVLS